MTSLALAPALDAWTLLREQHHRINNEFTSAINLVAVAAVRTDNPVVKAALYDVVELLQGQSEVHRVLTIPEGDVLIDGAEYLRRLGLALSRSKLDRMNIHLFLSSETLPLEAARCWLLGLIVHELVTNAVRHACFDTRNGEIKVRLMRLGSWVDCRVTDNGSGLGRIKLGRGLRIIADFASSLGGRIRHTSGTKWTSFALEFPLTQREQRANRAASRRPRTARRSRALPRLRSVAVAGERAKAVTAQASP